jgi:hypothetical protein
MIAKVMCRQKRDDMADKKTYGQAIIEHRQQNHTLDDDVIEYRRGMERSVVQDIHDTAKKARQHPNYQNKSFYVVLLFKVERIGQAARTLCFARQSCPTPIYKQAVWKYNHHTDALEFLWSIPDSILYWHIVRNKHQYLKDAECADLAKYVLLMESGDLLKWVKKENGEKIDAVIKTNIPTEEQCLTI